MFIGNVNASALAKTIQSNSVLDAGWCAFRTMLQSKYGGAGVWFDEVDEADSTQACSCCKRRPGPKGLEGLGVIPIPSHDIPWTGAKFAQLRVHRERIALGIWVNQAA